DHPPKRVSLEIRVGRRIHARIEKLRPIVAVDRVGASQCQRRSRRGVFMKNLGGTRHDLRWRHWREDQPGCYGSSLIPMLRHRQAPPGTQRLPPCIWMAMGPDVMPPSARLVVSWVSVTI